MRSGRREDHARVLPLRVDCRRDMKGREVPPAFVQMGTLGVCHVTLATFRQLY